jgi:hypothetical protein
MTEGAPRNLDVPPGPVHGPRGGGRVAAVALGALVIALAGAVGLAQLQPAPADPARISFAVPTVAPSPVAPSGLPAATDPPAQDPAAVFAATTPRMTRPDLEAAVRDGTLEGRLVFVDGTITREAAKCSGLTESFGGCVDLAIPGLGLPVRQGADTVPWRADPPRGAWLVTVARAGGLVYLGSLVPDPLGPPPVDAIANAGVPDAAGTLFEVRGWLVVHPLHTCFRPGVAATPCPPPPPFLADAEPLDGGILVSDAGAEVAVATSAPAIDVAAEVTGGTFLVQQRQSGEGGVLVVARFEPARAVRVLVP